MKPITMNQGITRTTILIIILVISVILFLLSNPFKGNGSQGPTPSIPPLTAPNIN